MKKNKTRKTSKAAASKVAPVSHVCADLEHIEGKRWRCIDCGKTHTVVDSTAGEDWV